MSSNSGASTRVSIPNTMRKTIQDIKEISGNHSDEDVYAMLKECSMDPNETAQRLLFLDTFHEVKRKRDKKKENVNGRMLESSRRKQGNQGRGARGGRGSFSVQCASHGLEDKRDQGRPSPALQVLKEVETNPTPSTSCAPVNGPTCLLSDDLSNGHVQNSDTVNTAFPSNVNDGGLIKPEVTLPQTKANTKHAPSADIKLVSIQSCDSQIPLAVGAGSLDIASNSKDSVISERDLSNSLEFADETQTNGHISNKVDTIEPCSSRSEKGEHMCPLLPKMNGEPLGTEKNSLSPVLDTVQAALPVKAIEEVTTKLDNLKCAEVQHVILPNHIQVPDAVKNVLSFGSLDARFAVAVTDINSSVINSSSNEASELLEDASSEETESCNEGTPTAQEEKYPDPPQAPQDVSETISSPENNFSAPKDDQVKQETALALGPPYPLVQPTTYGFGFMPPMLGSPLVPIEGIDHQARLLNSVIGNSLPMSTSAPTPPPDQSPGTFHGSVAASTQSMPLIRQPYPPSYIPYAHYFPPFFMTPTLQFLGHGSYPPQFPTGNMYLTAAAAAAAAASGMKVSSPYKPGTNLMNQAPVGVSSGVFGVYGSPQVGYDASVVVTSGTSNANEDIMPSVLKENNVYLGQQSEGTTVWLPAPGRDSITLPINPFFNLSPQSPHITISPQSIPGAFSAMYHPLQTVASTAAAQPHVRQPESMAGPPETAGPLPPPNSFHQSPQHQQMNWGGGY